MRPEKWNHEGEQRKPLARPNVLKSWRKLNLNSFIIRNEIKMKIPLSDFKQLFQLQEHLKKNSLTFSQFRYLFCWPNRQRKWNWKGCVISIIQIENPREIGNCFSARRDTWMDQRLGNYYRKKIQQQERNTNERNWRKKGDFGNVRECWSPMRWFMMAPFYDICTIVGGRDLEGNRREIIINYRKVNFGVFHYRR